MIFPSNPPKTKEEMVDRLKRIGEFRKTLDPFVLKLFDAFGFTIFMRSVIPCSGGEKVIKDAMEACKPKVALVIGTNRGVSTARVAQFCEKVYTIDIIDSDVRQKVWECLGLKNITDYVVKDNAEKYALISRLKFDFAFSDGDHAKDYQNDFEAVRKCGNVLTHEYWSESPVKGFLDALGAGELKAMGGNFALWREQAPKMFHVEQSEAPAVKAEEIKENIQATIEAPKRRGRKKKTDA